MKAWAFYNLLEVKKLKLFRRSSDKVNLLQPKHSKNVIIIHGNISMKLRVCSIILIGLHVFDNINNLFILLVVYLFFVI